jgi:carbamoyltransferase
MKKNYIGLANSCHDSAVAIVDVGGHVVFAEATERHMQNKRAFNLSPDVFLRIEELIAEYCEPDAELVVAYSWSDAAEELLRHQLADDRCMFDILAGLYGEIPDFAARPMAFTRFVTQSQLNAVSQRGSTLEYALSQIEAKPTRKWSSRAYDHHLAHAATACYTSPFREGVCAVLDGYGEGRAFACYEYRDGKIRELNVRQQGNNKGSLGAFYILVCDMCGFGHMTGEEWKVMGLAPYGRPNEELLDLFRAMIRVEGLNIEFCNDLRMLRLLKKMHERRRKKADPIMAAADIAYAGQQVFTEILLAYLGNLHALGMSDNLILGGGCALNSSANGHILTQTGFENLHVFSAPADDGNAIGAALLAFREDCPNQRPEACRLSPYLGSSLSTRTMEHVFQFGRIPGLSLCEDAPARAAELLAEGKIIGWLQGAAEFGPRALGNRSILADPRSLAVKNEINARIKFREEFRPFAPSILHEFGAEYFENYQESPYMERTLKFRPEVVAKVPGVVHRDGTGRLQTVRREWNERFHRLVTRFHELTGVPLVLNTSFNVMGKPIAHSVEDALALFYSSGLDALVMGDLVIEKNSHC